MLKNVRHMDNVKLGVVVIMDACPLRCAPLLRPIPTVRARRTVALAAVLTTTVEIGTSALKHSLDGSLLSL